jgi:hypothetical protein
MPVPVAPPLTFTCGFNAVQGTAINVNGQLTLQMVGLTGLAGIQLAGSDIDTFAVTLGALTLDTSNASATAVVQTDPDNTFDDKMFEDFFKSASALAAVTKAVNNALTGQLPSISTNLTTTLRNTLMNVLGS